MPLFLKVLTILKSLLIEILFISNIFQPAKLLKLNVKIGVLGIFFNKKSLKILIFQTKNIFLAVESICLGKEGFLKSQ